MLTSMDALTPAAVEADTPTVDPTDPRSVATALRLLQWEVADVAADLIPGRVTPERQQALAAHLRAMADVLAAPSDHPCSCAGRYPNCRTCWQPCHC